MRCCSISALSSSISSDIVLVTQLNPSRNAEIEALGMITAGQAERFEYRIAADSEVYLRAALHLLADDADYASIFVEHWAAGVAVIERSRNLEDCSIIAD